MMKPLQYKLGTLDFTPSANNATRNVGTMDIPLGPLFVAFAFEISGALTLSDVAANSNIPAKWARGDEANLLFTVKLEDQRGVERIRTSGQLMRKEAFFRLGRFPDPAPQIGDGATAAPSFKTTHYLVLSAPDYNKNMDLGWLTRLTGKGKLTVEIGAPIDLNGDATAWATPPVIDVYGVGATGEHVPLMLPDKEVLTGAFANSGKQKIEIRNRRLPIQALMLTAIAADTSLASPASVVGREDPRLIKTFAVRNGKVYHKPESTFTAAWNMQALRRGYPSTWNRALGAADTVDASGAASGSNQRFAQNSFENLLATQYIEFAVDGNITGIQTSEIDDLVIDVDLAAPCKYELAIIGGDPITSDELTAVGLTRPLRREQVMLNAMNRIGAFTPAERAALGLN